MPLIFAKFGDQVITTEERYVKGDFVYSLEAPLKIKISTLYLYLSNDGDLALYVGNKKVFPSEEYFSVVGVMFKIDLPKPIQVESGISSGSILSISPVLTFCLQSSTADDELRSML